MAQEVAVVVGVGPGLGFALCRRFVTAGMQVAAAARRKERVAELIGSEGGGAVRPYGCDASDAGAVEALFRGVEAELGTPGLVVFNAGAFRPGRVLDIDPAEFESCWRIGCLGGFLVARTAAAGMVRRGAGTIIFTGATASLRGGPGFANLAVPKFGLRALAQSLARELGRENIHVAHVIIDGQIESQRYRHLISERGPDSLLSPDGIAETYYQLHRQPRSTWTHELDLRPWAERF